MYSYGPPHMAEQKQDDQLEHTYSSYVKLRDVALRTCQRRWTIGKSGKRGSGISVLAAQHDDDDDIRYDHFIHRLLRSLFFNLSPFLCTYLFMMDYLFKTFSKLLSIKFLLSLAPVKHGQLSIGYQSNGSQTWLIKWNAVSSKQWSYWYCYMYALHGR